MVLLLCARWAEFVPALDGKNIVLAPWCERIACEEEVKNRTKATGAAAREEVEEVKEGEDGADAAPKGLTGAAKTLCIPFEQVRRSVDCVPKVIGECY